VRAHDAAARREHHEREQRSSGTHRQKCLSPR
jgi:hypothetical protein